MRVLSILVILLSLSVASFAQQALKTGQAAPDFEAQTIGGQTYNLSQLQGKVVVVTFWSTRCDICVAEIPKLNRVVERYKDKDVVFLAMTMEGNGKVETFLRKVPFNFGIVPNSFGVVLKYADKDRSGNINMGFPAHFVINKKGEIEHRMDGWDKAASLDSQISRLLAAE
ncbi:MAG: peroxiredoxin family protein [Blastocatellia bacterium]